MTNTEKPICKTCESNWNEEMDFNYCPECGKNFNPLSVFKSKMSIRDELITGTFAIGSDGQKEPIDWKEYALKLEKKIQSL